MAYSSYLVHFNRNHGKKDGKFTYGDGDGDGVSNDHGNPKDNKNTGDNKDTKSVITSSTLRNIKVPVTTRYIHDERKTDSRAEKYVDSSYNSQKEYGRKTTGTRQNTKNTRSTLTNIKVPTTTKNVHDERKIDSRAEKYADSSYNSQKEYGRKTTGTKQNTKTASQFLNNMSTLSSRTKTESNFTKTVPNKMVTAGSITKGTNRNPDTVSDNTNVSVGISQLIENSEKLEETKNKLNNVRSAVSEAVNSQVNQSKVESGLRYVSNLLTSVIGGSKKETVVEKEKPDSKPTAKKNNEKEYKKPEK